MMSSLPPGRAAEDWALAICPEGDTACVQRAASYYEQRIEAAIGAMLQPDAGGTATYRLRGASGADVGSLTLDGGQVMLCLRTAAGERCGVVGRGVDGAVAAENMLRLMGIEVTQA
jgi:hypothetical protein